MLQPPTLRRLAGGLLAVSLVAALGCGRPAARTGGATTKAAPAAAKAPATAPPEASLPPGCSAVASLAPDGLGALAPAARKLMASQAGRSEGQPDLDLVRGVHRVRYCQLPGAGASSKAHTSFVLAMAGAIPPDILDVLANASRVPLAHETIGGIAALGRPGAWLARREAGGGPAELVMASDQELLRAALVGPPGRYDLDPAAPLSIVLLREEIAKLLKPAESPDSRSALAAIRRLRFSLAAGARELSIYAAVGDPAAAKQVQAAMEPVVSGLIARMTGVRSVGALRGSAVAPKATTMVDGNEGVARIEVPARSLDALAAQIVVATNNVRAAPLHAGDVPGQPSSPTAQQ